VLWALAACGRTTNVPVATTTDSSPIPIPTTTITPALTSTPTLFPIQTSAVYPSTIIQMDYDLLSAAFQKANYTFNQQVTDGKLMLLVEEVDPKCHKIRKMPDDIDVRIAFRSLVGYPLYVASDFRVSMNSRIAGGDIIPMFYDQIGKRFGLSRDQIDYEIDLIPKSVIVIQPGEEFVSSIPILLPGTLSAGNGSLISPGQYLVKIIYQNRVSSMKGQENIWTGMISSNLIEFCMEE